MNDGLTVNHRLNITCITGKDHLPSSLYYFINHSHEDLHVNHYIKIGFVRKFQILIRLEIVWGNNFAAITSSIYWDDLNHYF